MFMTWQPWKINISFWKTCTLKISLILETPPLPYPSKHGNFGFRIESHRKWKVFTFLERKLVFGGACGGWSAKTDRRVLENYCLLGRRFDFRFLNQKWIIRSKKWILWVFGQLGALIQVEMSVRRLLWCISVILISSNARKVIWKFWKNRKSKRLLLGESEAALDHGADGGI